MNWISVEDRLPEFKQVVLVRSVIEGNVYYDVTMFDTKMFNGCYCNDPSTITKGATHWCEITEPSE